MEFGLCRTKSRFDRTETRMILCGCGCRHRKCVVYSLSASTPHFILNQSLRREQYITDSSRYYFQGSYPCFIKETLVEMPESLHFEDMGPLQRMLQSQPQFVRVRDVWAMIPGIHDRSVQEVVPVLYRSSHGGECTGLLRDYYDWWFHDGIMKILFKLLVVVNNEEDHYYSSCIRNC